MIEVEIELLQASPGPSKASSIAEQRIDLTAKHGNFNFPKTSHKSPNVNIDCGSCL
jgi:hypothetical protein